MFCVGFVIVKVVCVVGFVVIEGLGDVVGFVLMLVGFGLGWVYLYGVYLVVCLFVLGVVVYD